MPNEVRYYDSGAERMKLIGASRKGEPGDGGVYVNEIGFQYLEEVLDGSTDLHVQPISARKASSCPLDLPRTPIRYSVQAPESSRPKRQVLG